MRYAKANWTELGLTLLREQGPSALTVEQLCSAAGRTTGSFYHHFKDHDAFIEAMLERWKVENTETVIARVETSEADKAEELNALTCALDHRLESRIRQFAQMSATAQQIVGDVDRLRIQYLADLYAQSGQLNAKDAEQLARLEYAGLVGAQMLWPDASGEVYADLAAAFTKLTKGKEN